MAYCQRGSRVPGIAGFLRWSQSEVRLPRAEGIAVRRRLSPRSQGPSLRLGHVSTPRSANPACGFPARGPGRDHAFALAKLRFRTFRRTRPSSARSLASGMRVDFPECTLCFQSPPAQECPLEGSAATEGPTPQATAERDISALLRKQSAYRREEKIRTAVLRFSGRRRTAGIRVRWTGQARTCVLPLGSVASAPAFAGRRTPSSHFARPRVKG